MNLASEKLVKNERKLKKMKEDYFKVYKEYYIKVKRVKKVADTFFSEQKRQKAVCFFPYKLGDTNGDVKIFTLPIFKIC